MITLEILNELKRHVTAFGERYAVLNLDKWATFVSVSIEDNEIEFLFDMGDDRSNSSQTGEVVPFEEFLRFVEDHDAYFAEAEQEKREKLERELLEKKKKEQRNKANKRRREKATYERLKKKYG